MSVDIRPYTRERIDEVVRFEQDLRREEDCWGWEIDEAYLDSVRKSFSDDSAMIKSRFDGSTKAYLDWICVLKSYRHRGVAQALLEELRKRLKERGVDTLIALTAANEEAQRFYRSVPDSLMRDTGIWIDIK